MKILNEKLEKAEEILKSNKKEYRIERIDDKIVGATALNYKPNRYNLVVENGIVIAFRMG